MAQNFFVIDPSVALAWCFEDEGDSYTDGVLDGLADCSSVAPAVWPLEVSNALVVAERRGRLTPAESARALALLQQLPISVEQETLERTWSDIFVLARQQGLSTYDASYLHLAMRR